MMVRELQIVEERPAIIGDMSLMPLVEMIQTLGICRRTARIDVATSDGNVGVIYLESGAVVHAQWCNFVGREAFFQLCDLPDGRFCVCFTGIRAPRKTISGETMGLLLDAMKRRDELSSARHPDF